MVHFFIEHPVFGLSSMQKIQFSKDMPNLKWTVYYDFNGILVYWHLHNSINPLSHSHTSKYSTSLRRISLNFPLCWSPIIGPWTFQTWIPWILESVQFWNKGSTKWRYGILITWQTGWEKHGQNIASGIHR